MYATLMHEIDQACLKNVLIPEEAKGYMMLTLEDMRLWWEFTQSFVPTQEVHNVLLWSLSCCQVSFG